MMSFVKNGLGLLLFLCAGAKAQVQPTGSALSTDTGSVFNIVEKMAEFPGGATAWRKFLQTNLRADKPFLEMGAPAGRYQVKVRFIVDKAGKLSDITPLTHYGYGFEAEVIRVINLSGTWTPAEQKGRTVNSYHIQPVTFMMRTDKVTLTMDPEMPAYTLLANTDHPLGIKSFLYKKEDLYLVADSGTVATNGAGQFTIRIAKPGEAWVKIMLKDKAEPIELVHFEVLPQEAAPAPKPISKKPAATAAAFNWFTWEAAIAAQQKKPLPITVFAYSPGKNDALIAETEQLMFDKDGGTYVSERSYPVRFNINGTDTIQHNGKIYTNPSPNERHPFAKWLGVKAGGPYVLVFDKQGKLRNNLNCSEQSPVSVFGALSIVLNILGKP